MRGGQNGKKCEKIAFFAEFFRRKIKKLNNYENFIQQIQKFWDPSQNDALDPSLITIQYGRKDRSQLLQEPIW